METILIQPSTKKQSETIKAILNALDIRFNTSEDIEEAKEIAASVARGYQQMLADKSGQKIAKDARDLFGEL